jgi:hypothetical protein
VVVSVVVEDHELVGLVEGTGDGLFDTVDEDLVLDVEDEDSALEVEKLESVYEVVDDGEARPWGKFDVLLEIDLSADA